MTVTKQRTHLSRTTYLPFNSTVGSWSIMSATCQLPSREIQTISPISAGCDRHPLTYPHFARTHPQLHIAQPALFSIPQTLTSSKLQARGSGSSSHRVATKLLRYENSVVESSPEAHATPAASARQQTHKGCWNVTIETTRRR